jgi:hypothetical protein
MFLMEVDLVLSSMPDAVIGDPVVRDNAPQPPAAGMPPMQWHTWAKGVIHEIDGLVLRVDR